MSIFDKYDLVDVNNDIEIPKKPESGVVVITGASGSGKTTIMKAWGMPQKEYCEETPIYKLFKTEEDAEKSLIMFGLRTIPAWRKGLCELSNGERQRALFALNYHNGIFYCDEFTSLVDRDTARALCNSINKVRPNSLVVASCHDDILSFLDWDSAYNVDSSQWVDRGSLRREMGIRIKIESCETEKVWRIFKKHHYLSGKVNKSANSFVASIDGKPVAMTSVVPMPSGTLKDAWRGHRTVVLPEFQGMGIGTSLSDCVAEMIVKSGARFFSKTAHPAMGEHRELSKKWKPTSKNKKSRKDYDAKRSKEWTNGNYKELHRSRVCYSHEYIG